MDPILEKLRQALEYDRDGHWDEAHETIQPLEDPRAYWIHGYLHRKEGDLTNAGYWYSSAGRAMPTGSLEKEWQDLHDTLLG